MSIVARGPVGRLAVSAIGLEIFLGVGAIGGGAALMLGPRGEIIPLPISALAGTPFGSYLVPGLILFTVLGVGPLGAAALTGAVIRLPRCSHLALDWHFSSG